jgi:mannose-6-phosphate isomerase-like protein (cupin superfamily)
MTDTARKALVRHRDETPPAPWKFGQMQRIVTGGEGGIANVHVARIKALPRFFHSGYDEVYYVLGGEGTITLDGDAVPLRPGSVAVIPAGVTHALAASQGEELEIVIFGTPPIPITDERARPIKA